MFEAVSYVNPTWKAIALHSVLRNVKTAVFLKQQQQPLCLQDNLGAIDYLCIVAKVALLVQKEDNYYMSRLRDTNNLGS